MSFPLHKIPFCAAVLAVLVSTGVAAQSSISSPYSRFGVGDLQTAGVNQSLGMGGTCIGIYSGQAINLGNPAAFGKVSLTTFEAGLNGNFIRLDNGVVSGDQKDVSLGYFALSMPLKQKKSGLAFGIVPFSKQGYSLSEERTDTTFSETHAYEGSGGLNRFFVATGFTPLKQLTVGVNASVLFGDIVQQRRVEFNDATYLNTRWSDTRSNLGFNFNVGAQYTFDSLSISPADSVTANRHQIELLNDSIVKLRKSANGPTDAVSISALQSQVKKLKEVGTAILDRHQRGAWSLTFGATVSPSGSINSTRSIVAESFRYVNNSTKDQVVVRDTLENNSEKGKIKLPLGFGLGVSMKQGNRWLVGTDIRIENWSGYRSFGETDSLADSWRWSAGVQFTPDDRGFNSYFKQLQYMAGVHYSNSFLQLKGLQLTEAGIAAGVGMPVRRGVSTIRFMAEVGKRGTLESGLLEERYFRFTFSFTLNDRWFIKQRYD